MKLKWKDFLYFQKNDRNAIILLLLLIVVCGGFSAWYNSHILAKNVELQDSALAEFDSFQLGLTNNHLVNAEHNEEGEKNSDRPDKKKKSGTALKKLATGETIELNGASDATLKRIPGIGDEYARRILEYRNQLGGFTSAEQLKEVQGITNKRYTNISPYITIKQKPKLIRINKQTKNQILKHPYLNEKQVDVIVNLRQQNGKIKTFGELLENNEFTPRDIERISGYISFD